MLRQARVFIILLFFLVDFSALFALTPIYNIQKLTLENGLSSDFVYDVTQDHNDLMWVATEWGLNCYDGKNIRKFFHNADDSTSISNNLIQSLFFDDKRKELWVGTNNGLNRYNYETENFTRFSHFDDNHQQIFGDIVEILPCGEKYLWVCSYLGGVLRFEKETGKFERILSDLQKEQSWRGLDAISMFDDKLGNIWIGTAYNGVLCYQVEQDTFKLFPLIDPENGQRFPVRDFFTDSEETIWLATGRGLFCKRRDENHFSRYDLIDEIKTNSLFFIERVRNREVWIGSENGVVRLDWEEFIKDKGVPTYETIRMKRNGEGLSFRSVRNLSEDKYKNIWISTYSGGVNYIPGSDPNFRTIYSLGAEGEASLSNKTLCIGDDNAGNLYLGTDGWGINKFDPSHNLVEQIKFDKGTANLNVNIIQTLYCDSANILWAGTYEGGLVRYDPTSKKIRILNSGNSQLPGDDIREVVGYKDEVVVGGKNGITFLDSQGNVKRVFRTGEAGLMGHDIRRMLVLPSGDMWLILYNGGLSYFDRSEELFITYVAEPGRPGALPDNMIEDILLSRSGRLWILSRNAGLSYLDEKSGLFVPVDLPGQKQGFVRMFEDEKGTLWFCGMSFIAKYNPSEGNYDTYTNDHILRTGMYFASSALLGRNGNIYFGGANGVLYFSPQKIAVSTRPSLRPLLVDFTLYNQSVPISTPKEPTLLKKSLLLEDQVELQYHQSVFAIHYVSPNYGYMGELKYAYKLEGEDQTWNYVGNRTFAEYRNLHYGNYEFLVKVSNQDGVWNMEPTRLKIVIHPPLWKTPGMYLLYAILFILLLYGMFRMLTYRLNLYNSLRYARLERDKTEELYQSKLQFFTNISHEFRTPVTLITNPIDRLLSIEDDSEKQYLLSVMKRNSDRLLRLVNQLLDLRRVDRNGFKLHIREFSLSSLLEEIYNSFKEFSHRRNIHFVFDYQLSDHLFWLDEEIVSKCVYNLLSNAFKFTEDGGTVTLRIATCCLDKKAALSIEVTDTGRGISSERLQHIFKRFYQQEGIDKGEIPGSGIGLHLVKELMELHRGEIRVSSEFERGSVFTLYFPLDLSLFKPEDFYEEKKVGTGAGVPDSQTNRENEGCVYSPTSNEDDSKERKIILVVDDEPDIREFLEHHLRPYYTVFSVENGEQALEFVRNNYVDLVLSDVMMPLMDGVELCAQLKNDMATCHIPLVLLTAKTALPSQVHGLEAGADDYIAKPFHLEYVMAKVAAILRHTERLQQKYAVQLGASTLSTNLNEEAPSGEVVKELTLNDIFIEKAVDFILAELDNADFNGELLAARLNMSRVHLHRKLKMIVNITTSEFIRNVRLKEGAKMLREGKMNVSEVSYAIGFNSPAYFSSCFTKYFGVSPKEFMSR